jgi:hypothetical protein
MVLLHAPYLPFANGEPLALLGKESWWQQSKREAAWPVPPDLLEAVLRSPSLSMKLEPQFSMQQMLDVNSVGLE